jgi:hypothetical protein
MQLSPGTRLRSTVCTSQLIVVKAPAGSDVDLRCGGAAVVTLDSDVPTVAGDVPAGNGTQIGKRYRDEELGLEVLCTKPGAGSLSVGEVPLPLAEARALPSSD